MSYQVIEFSSRSFEELAFQVGQWQLSVYQLAPGKLSGYSHGVRLPGIDIGMRQTSLAMAQVGKVPVNSWTLTFPDYDDGVIVGGCFGAANMQLSSNDGMRHYTRPATVYALSIDNELLKNIKPKQNISVIINRLEGCIEVAPEKKAWIKQLVAQTVTAFQQTPRLSDAMANELRNRLVDACRDYLDHILSLHPQLMGSSTENKRICTDRREKILLNALRYIHRQNISTVSLTAITNYACTTPRNLEYIFKDYLAMSPKMYLMCLRFSAIRLALLRPENSTATISDIINEYGVSNEGRFSQQYSQFFGELPKDTRQKTSVTASIPLALVTLLSIMDVAANIVDL